MVDIPHPKLWTPNKPFLYDLKVYLLNSENEIVDSVKSYFGMRKISLGKDSDGITKMMLNNKFVFEFGLLDQGWWPDGLYTAPTDEALRFDITMTKQMGFNLARKHVKVEPDRWYYWCDKLGLLVWQDMPSGDKGIGPNDPDIKRSSESAKEYLNELNEMINEKFNHPSIVMWVPYNEGWGQWNTEYVVKFIQRRDTTRLIDCASGWTDRNVGSVHDIHDYPGPSMPEPEKKRAVVLGEFGGLGLPLEGHTWKQKGSWGYRNLKNKEELQNAYESLIEKLMLLKMKGLSAAVYTQTTDVEVEVNGLMTYDRMPKIDPAVLSRINRGYLAPAIESDSKIFIDSLFVKILNVAPEGEVRFTIRGGEPTEQSTLYKTPFVIKKDAIVKAKVFWNNRGSSKTSEQEFKKVNPLNSTAVKNLKPGLKFHLYKNNNERWSKLPNWNSLKPDMSGITDSVSLDFKNTIDDFGIVFNGYINIPKTGVYTFYLDSDDGSRLLIDNTQVVDNDSVHGMIELQGDIALSAGYHSIQIQYFQGMGGKGIRFKYNGPGFDKRFVEPSVLFH